MKHYIYTLIGAIVMFITSSCSDSFTDVDPLVGIPEDVFQSSLTQDDIESILTTMYNYMSEEEMFGRGFMWYINASDDMVTGRTKAAAAHFKNFQPTGDEGYASTMFNTCYKGIRSANEALSDLSNITSLNSDLKKQYMGEAYFMRGFYYFWLASTWGNDVSGGLPIVTLDNMYDTPTRPASVVDNYKQIVEDLTKAAQLLPLVTEYTGDKADYLERANKDACYAYMAKTCLYWAQYDKSKYKDVIAYCDSVTNSDSGRDLIDTNNPGKDFRSVFTYENEYGSEYIWSVRSTIDRGSKLPGVMLENGGWSKYNGWGYFMPTEELYNEFEEGDYRRKATILNFGDTLVFLGDTMHYYSVNSTSGFQFNKYMDIFKTKNAIGTLVNTNGDALYSEEDVPLLRYAEVLLMKAEAEIMSGGNGDAEINKVRDRAGLPPKTGCTMADLKHERRVELAGEYANRHRDLVRWNDAKETYSKALHGRIHTNGLDPTSDYTIEEIWAARDYDPDVNNVWMIPNDVIESLKISQNKGY
jgi:hypothetical protein